jgi:hypothetical protein
VTAWSGAADQYVLGLLGTYSAHSHAGPQRRHIIDHSTGGLVTSSWGLPSVTFNRGIAERVPPQG